MKQTRYLLLLTALTIAISGCQASPGKTVVVSKNDGSFDVKIAQSAESTHSPDDTQMVSYAESFSSTDGSVQFNLKLDHSIQTPGMPVLEVVPHTLTEADAYTVAQALRGASTTFLEAEPRLNEKYSRQDILSLVERWTPYTSASALQRLFPNNAPAALEEDAQTIRDTIAFLTDSHLDNNTYTHPSCQWRFHKSSYYLYGTESGGDAAQENDEISAWIPNADGRYSVLTASRRDKRDYKLNNIYYEATASGPLMLDYEIYRAEKLRTAKPTEEQIQSALKLAQTMMQQMQLGEWTVQFSDILTNEVGEDSEYIIALKAYPVLHGVAAIPRPQLDNLKSEQIYASNYYLTEANFEFAPDGTLMGFTLYSPIDVRQVVNENVRTLSTEEIIRRSKAHLQLSDAYRYCETLPQSTDDFHCTVDITRYEYGLSRSKAPNTDESYYYTPSVLLRGNVECMDSNQRTIYYREDIPLLMLNAIDGSVISLENE